MNVNATIVGMKDELHIPVSADRYSGNEKKYITFAYEDERPEWSGDNTVIEDRAYIYVNLFTPADFNYMSLKHRIRDYLESKGFEVVSISSRLDPIGDSTGSEYIRHTIFETEISEAHKQEA